MLRNFFSSNQFTVEFFSKRVDLTEFLRKIMTVKGGGTVFRVVKKNFFVKSKSALNLALPFLFSIFLPKFRESKKWIEASSSSLNLFYKNFVKWNNSRLILSFHCIVLRKFREIINEFSVHCAKMSWNHWF